MYEKNLVFIKLRCYLIPKKKSKMTLLNVHELCPIFGGDQGGGLKWPQKIGHQGVLGGQIRTSGGSWNFFDGFFYIYFGYTSELGVPTILSLLIHKISGLHNYTFPKKLCDIVFISNIFRCYLTPKRKGNMTCMGLWKVRIRGQAEVDMVFTNKIQRMVLKVICLLKRYSTCFSVRFLNFKASHLSLGYLFRLFELQI